MKRVLMVSCGGLGNGGVQAIMMGIVRNLSNDYHFDMLLFTSEVRHYDDEFLKYGGKILRIPHYEGNCSFFKRVAPYLRDIYIYYKTCNLLASQEHYDIIHCNNQYDSAPILKAASLYSIPIRICHTHIITFKSNFFLDLLNRLRFSQIRRYATHFIGCSKEACDSFFEKSTIYRVIPNFYDDKKYVFSSLNNPGDYINITQVGAFSHNKNQSFSISIVKELITLGEKARLNLIGFNIQEGYKDFLEGEIKRLGLEENVFFYPDDYNIPSILEKTNVFLMPSEHEGFGIVLIEAQATGVCCYASNNIPSSTNCGGIKFLDISHSASAKIWAKEISEAYKKEELVHKLFDTNRFKLSVIIPQYKRIYENV